MSALWHKFMEKNPLWDKFRYMATLKQAIYAFFPVVESMAMEPDKNDVYLTYLGSIIDGIQDRNKKDGRDIERVLRPVKKISLGLLAGDPAWRNISMRFIAAIRYGKEPPFTERQKAFLRTYGYEIP
jgi:hypothetical protein